MGIDHEKGCVFMGIGYITQKPGATASGASMYNVGNSKCANTDAVYGLVI